MPEKVKIIEWHHLEKKKYFLFMNVYMFSTNAVLFPVELIKTRLQLQRTKALYNHTFDVAYKTVKHEGFLGLYKGFPVNQLAILTGHLYSTSYEVTREHLSIFQNACRGFIAGGLAAVIEQSFINPVDVIAQRLMVEGQGQRQRHHRPSKIVVKHVLREHGISGFYRGFTASLMVEGLWSAIWWASYSVCLDTISQMVPNGTSHLVIQGLSGMLAGVSSAVAGNPIDIIRVRMQVSYSNVNPSNAVINPFTLDSDRSKTDKFSKITNRVKLKNKQHHSKELLNSFPVNGHTLGFP